MANAINRTVRDSDGKLLRVYSQNTPSIDTDDWLVNPDLSGVAGVAEYYWKVTGTPPAGAVEEMTAPEKTAADATRLTATKMTRKSYLQTRADDFVYERYNGNIEEMSNIYTDTFRVRPNRSGYVQPWVDWLTEVAQEINTKQGQVDTQTTVTGVNGIELDEQKLNDDDPHVGFSGIFSTNDDITLESFVDTNARVTDPDTDISGPFYLMQILDHRRDLYNDDENPLYVADHQPILGETGILNEQAGRIQNIETILSKNGWFRQLVTKSNYQRPKDNLIYYGWLNSYNSAVNNWDNELVAQDLARYGILVFGAGLQNPAHGDYSNTQIIIPRIKELNPNALIFGYVTTDQAQVDFETKASQWDTLQVDGIFMDEAGYDFGRTRQQLNDKVDYVHGLTYADLCFANAWNTNHILGTSNDASFPNSTYNPPPDESNLANTDWILLESFPINTEALQYNDGYEPFWDWAARGNTMVSLRGTYGVNFAANGVIDNGVTGAQQLFDFGFISALMFSLGSYGTSDTNYAASSAAATLWDRPDTTRMGAVWNLSPSVQENEGVTGIFYRYVDTAKMTLDFAEGGETGIIARW